MIQFETFPNCRVDLTKLYRTQVQLIVYRPEEIKNESKWVAANNKYATRYYYESIEIMWLRLKITETVRRISIKIRNPYDKKHNMERQDYGFLKSMETVFTETTRLRITDLRLFLHEESYVQHWSNMDFLKKL
jgi:hypothetical protein